MQTKEEINKETLNQVPIVVETELATIQEDIKFTAKKGINRLGYSHGSKEVIYKISDELRKLGYKVVYANYNLFFNKSALQFNEWTNAYHIEIFWK